MEKGKIKNALMVTICTVMTVLAVAGTAWALVIGDRSKKAENEAEEIGHKVLVDSLLTPEYREYLETKKTALDNALLEGIITKEEYEEKVKFYGTVEDAVEFACREGANSEEAKKVIDLLEQADDEQTKAVGIGLSSVFLGLGGIAVLSMPKIEEKLDKKNEEKDLDK